MNDDEIIRLLYERDESGLSAIEEKYGRLLRSVAFGILRNEQDAEECESDALLRAWNSIPPARPARLTAYLCRIVRNAALDKYNYIHAAKRSGEAVPLDELTDCIGSSPDASDRLSENELARLLNSFLMSQDYCTRVIFMRRYWFGDTTAEIAKRLHVSQSMIKSRISRTLKKLRAYLREEGYDL